MMVYQKIFAEYSTTAAQVLMTKATVMNDKSRRNAQNTFNELLNLGAVPIVNENDTVSTYEIKQVQTLEIMTGFQQLLLQLLMQTSLYCYQI